MKPVHVDYQSKAYDNVEKGNKLFVAGKFEEAMAAYDDAAVKDQESPVPWFNGGLAAKEMGHLGAAKMAANTAFKLGEYSVRGKVISADIDIARKQFDPAKSKLDQALFADPNDSYGLSEYAKWNLSRAHLRDAERYMWLGFRDGAPIVLDSKMVNQSGVGGQLGNKDLSVSYGKQAIGSFGALSLNAGAAIQTAGGSARQQLEKLDLNVSTPFGILGTNIRSLTSDRPGTSSPSLLLPSTPGSKLDFNHTMIGLQKTLDHWTFQANYRSEKSDLRSGSFAPFATDNHESQWILEGRYDSPQWIMGGGYSVVHRNSSATPGIEPLEMIFPEGTTNMYNSYVVNRQALGKNINLTSGAIFTSAAGLEQVGVTGQVAVRLIGSRYLRLGVRPGINRVQTNLGPISDMAGSVGMNSLDRLTDSTLEFNRDVAIPGLNSRLTNAYFALPIGNNINVYGFRNTFTNQNFLNTDPQSTAALNPSLVQYGKVTGLTLEGTSVLSPSTNFRLAVTSQVAKGTIPGPIFDYSTGNPVVSKSDKLPNVSNFEANASFDWSNKQMTYALSAHYVGDRFTAIPNTTNAGLPPGTYLVPVGAGLFLEGHFSMNLSPGRAVDVSVYNLANTGMYPGFRGGPQVVIGYSARS